MSRLAVSHITLRDTTIMLRGEASSAVERAALILAAGNIAGIATVHADITVPERTPDPVFHQVAPGETLDLIADRADTPVTVTVTVTSLQQANAAELSHHEGVYPGQTIHIPEG